MFRVSALTGCAVLLVALLVGTGRSGDTKKDPPRKQIQLPQGWKKLGLGDDQRKKIIATRAKFQATIESLRQQIERARKDEMVECIKLLTEDQKESLRKAAAAKAPPVEKKATEEKTTPDKK